MYMPYLTIFLSASCAFIGIQASTAKPATFSDQEIKQIVEELTTPLNDGFQIRDLFSIANILHKHLSSMENLSIEEKKENAVYLLQQVMHQRYFTPSFEQKMLEQMLPALATVLFPTSIDTLLEQPAAENPSQQEIFEATRNLLVKLDNRLDWDDISDCILYVLRFASSYKDLSAQDRAYIAKQILKEVIDKTDTPLLPDVIFDEVFKRIGYAMIDYLTLQN